MSDAGGIAERAFFREEFRRSTIIIALRDDGHGPLDVAASVIGELMAGESRVLVVADSELLARSRLVEHFGSPAVEMPGPDDELAALWTTLEDTGVRLVGVDGDPALPAVDLARRLGVAKLVLTDPAGGWGTSFASVADLDSADPVGDPASHPTDHPTDRATDQAVDQHGVQAGDPHSGQPGRATVAAAVRAALDGGIDGVNLCRIVDLDTELFTFDGAGTLFTAGSYIRITPLRADDLPVVEQLVARGVAEGFLRPRPRREVVRLAFGGLGARVGAAGHLAGLGTLETERYVTDSVAEIVCLYTVNRYAGEGVGRRLVEGLVDTARAGGAQAVFACTVSARAAELFERSAFTEVAHDRVPDAKWVGYDPGRRAGLSVHWRDLATDAEPVSSGETK